MLDKNKLTEIYYIADEFSKAFERELRAHQLPEAGKKTRNRAARLSDSEVITILLCFHLSHVRDFKSFYIGYVQKHLQAEFPQRVSYNRFTELSQRALLPLMMFTRLLCKGECTGISFIDSMSIKVCHNKRIHQHKVFKEIAQRGHCSLGWFFGFKLHLVINDKGELLNFTVTRGNVDDRNDQVINTLVKNLFGKLYGDKGYLSKSLFEKLFHQGVHLVTKIKSNMKNQLMSLRDKVLLRKRALIETVNDELKNICQVEHSRHRSFAGFLLNLLSAVGAYHFFPKKPSINVSYVRTNQLSL